MFEPDDWNNVFTPPLSSEPVVAALSSASGISLAMKFSMICVIFIDSSKRVPVCNSILADIELLSLSGINSVPMFPKKKNELTNIPTETNVIKSLWRKDQATLLP